MALQDTLNVLHVKPAYTYNVELLHGSVKETFGTRFIPWKIILFLPPFEVSIIRTVPTIVFGVHGRNFYG